MANHACAVSHRLIADCMLGRLARWLRILGCDVVYDTALGDRDLVERAVAEHRLILTRDRRLVLRRRARRHLLIRSENLERQLVQVVRELHIEVDAANLFGRCLLCNELLNEIPAAEAHPRVPPFVAQTQEHFRQCPQCDRIYWTASHVKRVIRHLSRIGVVGEQAAL